MKTTSILITTTALLWAATPPDDAGATKLPIAVDLVSADANPLPHKKFFDGILETHDFVRGQYRAAISLFALATNPATQSFEGRLVEGETALTEYLGAYRSFLAEMSGASTSDATAAATDSDYQGFLKTIVPMVHTIETIYDEFVVYLQTEQARQLKAVSDSILATKKERSICFTGVSKCPGAKTLGVPFVDKVILAEGISEFAELVQTGSVAAVLAAALLAERLQNSSDREQASAALKDDATT